MEYIKIHARPLALGAVIGAAMLGTGALAVDAAFDHHDDDRGFGKGRQWSQGTGEPLRGAFKWNGTGMGMGMGGAALLTDVSAKATSTLSDTERADLLFIYEEEKMARDIYSTLGEKWGWQTIGHVSRSESMHMSVMASLLDRYGIPEPTQIAEQYVDADIRDLALRLVSEGNDSALDAVKTGLYVEEFDIADLRARMERTDNTDIHEVYQHLLDGSYAHLRFFSTRLAQIGGTYEPQVLSREDFDTIARSATSGMMGGRGGGQRGGMMRW